MTGALAPFRARARRALVPGLVAAAVTVAALLQLFLGPDLGLADNGDGRRVLCGSGLQPPPLSTAFTEVVFDVAPLHDAPAGACDNAALRYSTSQIVLVDGVRWVDALVSAPGLDLRVVGVVACVLLGLAMGWLYAALSGGRLVRLATVGAASALLLDVSYLHYFSSPFSETAGFLGIVGTTAALAWLARRPLGTGPLLALLVAATFLLTAKSQLTPLVVLVVAALLLRARQHRTAAAAGTEGPSSSRRPALLAWGLAACLVLGSALQLAYQGPGFRMANIHNLVLFTVAPLDGDPAEALEEMGLDPAQARHAGTSYFNAPDTAGDPDYPDFLESAGRLTVAGYLLRHPDIALTMLERGVGESTQPRTPYLPELRTADRTDGQAAADRYAPATAALDRVQPVAWPLLPLLWTAMAVWGVVLAVRRTVRGVDLRSWGYPLAFAALAAPAQVVVALLGDGYYELAKHTVFVGYLTWLALALCLGSLVCLVPSTAFRRRTPPAEEDSEPAGASPAPHPAHRPPPSPATRGESESAP
jgi:hypothetical protein